MRERRKEKKTGESRETPAWAGVVHYLIAESRARLLPRRNWGVKLAGSTTIAVQLIQAGAQDAREQPNSLNLL